MFTYKTPDMKQIAIKYGMWMLAGFIAFFLIMYLIGQADNTYLRLFNGVIHLTLMGLAINEYRKLRPDTVHNYVSGVGTAFYTSAFGVIGFGVFMMIFLSFDPQLMQAINDHIPLDTAKTGFNPVTSGVMVIAEGIATTLVGSYIITRIIDARLEESSMPTSSYEG